METQINALAQKYAFALNEKMAQRLVAMKEDDTSHYLLYKVLGIDEKEGHLIDLYQNKGRFLHKYAGSFLEEATRMCFQYKYPEATKKRLENTLGSRPKTFEIDCLVGNKAYEIKWRDATTDGDHITKEHTRVKVIQNAGFRPIRIMFYYPSRDQAIKIQKTLETLYLGVGGLYIYGENAWDYLASETGVNLKQILCSIAAKKEH